jgi:hypothetical protein
VSVTNPANGAEIITSLSAVAAGQRLRRFEGEAARTAQRNTTPMIRGPTRARIRYNEAFLPATSGAARSLGLSYDYVVAPVTVSSVA